MGEEETKKWRDRLGWVVLVCGGRGPSIEISRLVHTELSRLQEELHPEEIVLVVQGGAPGVDSIAKAWATKQGIQTCTFHANWGFFDNKAGHIRNANQLRYGAPMLANPGSLPG